MQTHELHFSPLGIASVRYIPSGEAMHSHIGPWEEANLLYVKQGRLAERLQSGDSEPLVIYDLGLGIAANVVASLECLKSLPKARPLHVYSFENDLTGLRLGLEQIGNFPFLEPYQGILNTLLAEGHYESESGDFRWVLREGDFLKLALTDPEPELIFFDFYSPKTSPEMWTYFSFKRLFDCAERRRLRGKETLLLTYSAATAVRSALVLAGFHVGYGTSTPAKVGTTVAATDPALIEKPLDARWFDKFQASTKPLPLDWPLSRFHEAKAVVMGALGLSATEAAFHEPPKTAPSP